MKFKFLLIPLVIVANLILLNINISKPSINRVADYEDPLAGAAGKKANFEASLASTREQTSVSAKERAEAAADLYVKVNVAAEVERKEFNNEGERTKKVVTDDEVKTITQQVETNLESSGVIEKSGQVCAEKNKEGECTKYEDVYKTVDGVDTQLQNRLLGREPEKTLCDPAKEKCNDIYTQSKTLNEQPQPPAQPPSGDANQGGGSSNPPKVDCRAGMCETLGSPVCSGAYVFTGGSMSGTNDGTYACVMCDKGGYSRDKVNCATAITEGKPVVLMYDANSKFYSDAGIPVGSTPCFDNSSGGWVQVAYGQQKESGEYCGGKGWQTDPPPKNNPTTVPASNPVSDKPPANPPLSDCTKDLCDKKVCDAVTFQTKSSDKCIPVQGTGKYALVPSAFGGTISVSSPTSHSGKPIEFKNGLSTTTFKTLELCRAEAVAGIHNCIINSNDQWVIKIDEKKLIEYTFGQGSTLPNPPSAGSPATNNNQNVGKECIPGFMGWLSFDSDNQCYKICPKDSSGNSVTVLNVEKNRMECGSAPIVSTETQKTTTSSNNAHAGETCGIFLAGIFGENGRCSVKCPRDENGEVLYEKNPNSSGGSDNFRCGKSSTELKTINPDGQVGGSGGGPSICKYDGGTYRSSDGQFVCPDENGVVTLTVEDEEISTVKKKLEKGESCKDGNNSSCMSGECSFVSPIGSDSRDWYCMGETEDNRGLYDNYDENHKLYIGNTCSDHAECGSGYCANYVGTDMCAENPFEDAQSSIPSSSSQSSLNTSSNPSSITTPAVAAVDTGQGTGLNTAPLTPAGPPAANISGGSSGGAAKVANVVQPVSTQGLNANNFVYYSQRDPKWVTSQDGTTRLTMATHGCGTTVASMLYTNYSDKPRNPLETRDTIFTHPNYVNSGFYFSAAIVPLEGEGFTFKDVSRTGSPLGEAAKATYENPVVFGFKYEGAKNGHYVLSVGKDENGYPLVYDPFHYAESGDYAPVSLSPVNYPGLDVVNADILVVNPPPYNEVNI